MRNCTRHICNQPILFTPSAEVPSLVVQSLVRNRRWEQKAAIKHFKYGEPNRKLLGAVRKFCCLCGREVTGQSLAIPESFPLPKGHCAETTESNGESSVGSTCCFVLVAFWYGFIRKVWAGWATFSFYSAVVSLNVF